ncbi:uncharacterized protein RJT20DRAFT_43627 [Scheffersomyces xylosifermentans]|uniref:uncharacterized protein n=1 Tax=Scheffersomyces xylosifermentans TaxID=1304137 RepID=UPI00315D967A
MSNYFTQFIPFLGKNGPTQNSNPYISDETAGSSPQIQYITIFNPEFVTNDRAESSDELFKQILCFISPKHGQPEVPEEQRIEQLKIVGLVRGVNSFASSFSNNSKTENEVTIIKSSKSSILLFNLEGNFYLACSIALAVQKNKTNFVNQQLIKLIEQAHNYFTLTNTSLANMLDKYSMDILEMSLTEFWLDFMSSYNKQYYTIPPGLAWPNSLNYKGFLGLLPPPAFAIKRTYKRSSLSFNYTVKAEIDSLIQGEYNSSTEVKIPKGIIVSYFNKSNPKKYGLMYMNTVYDKEIEKEKVSKNSLIDIYNWLEYHDYHGKMDTANLTSISSSGSFATNLDQPELQPDVSPTADGEYRSIRELTSSALDMLHPVNVTNNLVISPLNYTVNSMISIGGQIKNIGNRSDIPPEPEESVANGWFSIPPILKSLTLGTLADQTETQIPNEGEESDNEEDEYTGEYLIGAKMDSTTGQKIIHRKLVYLKTNCRDDENNIYEKEREYSLVIFAKDDVYITLVYDSSNPQIDQINFYEALAEDTLIPAIEEITATTMSGSLMTGSIGSLRSLKGLLAIDDLDSDFFFVVYDSVEGSIKSSLPFLPNIKWDPEDAASRSVIRYQSAMHYLHDQLSSIFLMQSNKDFFHNNSMNEYFHKFTSNKQNDWMFYYIRHKGKYIIVIKNHNHNAKAAKKKSAVNNPKRQSAIPSPITVASDASNHTGVANQGIINRITDGVADYAHLGFLDNLGDDVKYWLAGLTQNGDT